MDNIPLFPDTQSVGAWTSGELKSQVEHVFPSTSTAQPHMQQVSPNDTAQKDNDPGKKLSWLKGPWILRGLWQAQPRHWDLALIIRLSLWALGFRVP